MNRRKFLGSTAMAGAAAAATATSGPGRAAGSHGGESVKIGFLAPLTGDVAAWGLPGLYGCEIWAEKKNAEGGIEVGGQTYDVEIIAYDDEYLPEKARTGAQKLIQEDGVSFIEMLGGDTMPAVTPIANRAEMLVSTLLPSDLSPDTPFLVAPAEVHPIYNVTGVWWLAEYMPEAKTAVICAQDDALGRPSVATYLAAFEAHGIEVKDVILFDVATTDFAPVMAAMLAHKPDILCLDTAYAEFVNALCKQAYVQDYSGQIISCTVDFYADIIANTSEAFMEGVIFQFPDFDDPALNDARINFAGPNSFFQTYNERYPGQWSAVSWEYASILDLWLDGAQKAGSIEPAAVLEGMKSGGMGAHAFGEAQWWGKDLFGIDNALVGNWPVVQIQNGKAVIVEFKNIPDWWSEFGEVVIK
ncbi:MAG: ABC transporter substrate-binding protein, partial [Rhodospirillaceae bacterium]|nr:ABC transporter substrate-binding protein [Rhodospirillaceae bacterium]